MDIIKPYNLSYVERKIQHKILLRLGQDSNPSYRSVTNPLYLTIFIIIFYLSVLHMFIQISSFEVIIRLFVVFSHIQFWVPCKY